MGNNGQYDDLNAHDIQAILDNSAEVIREVEAGSTAYSAQEYQHAQDTQRELAVSDYLDSVKAVQPSLSGMSTDQLVGITQKGTYPG